jgi:hypothetical protein
MVRNIEMDEKVNLATQLQQQNVGPVTLIIMYTVNPEDEDLFVKTWALAAQISKKMTPGSISSQLHRGVAGSRVFVSYHIFESTEAIRHQYTNPDFPAKLSEYPSNVVASAHVFKKVAVPGICLD